MGASRKAGSQPVDERSGGPHPSGAPPEASLQEHLSPLAFLAITVVSIFVAEAFVMLLLSALPPLSGMAQGLLDAFLLSALVLPALYLFLYRPMVRHLGERERAQEALRESEERFRFLCTSAPIGIFLTDAEGACVYANPHLLQISGLTLEESLGQGWTRGIHPDEREAVLEEVAETVREGRDFSREFRKLTPKGEVRWVRVQATGVLPQAGKRVGRVGTVEDITERRQAQQAQARLATLVEQMAEGVFVTDTEGTIEYVNPAFERITGYAREEALGQNPAFLDSGEQDPACFEELRHTIGRGEVWAGQLVSKRKDGTLYEQDATISPIRDAAGEIVSFVAIQRDVTREVELEVKLRQAQKMEAVGQLAGGVAHDFNNLLVAILGYTDLALEGIEPDDARRADLLQVRTAAESAATLTRQLLAFSRQQTLQPIDLDLNEAIADLVNMLRRVIGEDIELDIIPGHRLGTVHADPAQIEQVLMNLCLNARDAMRGGGKITIETENVVINSEYCKTHPWAKEGRYDLLSVTDTGRGMDDETISRVFEPFFTTKQPGEGTGLGLAMVYGIVKQHDGMIHVYSEPDKGTTFKIYLPTAQRPATKIGRKITGPARGGTETILLAEDDQQVRDLAARVLEGAGYTVLTAGDGEQALRVFEAHAGEIDLALLDVVMPKLGGRAVRDSIHALRRDMRFLFSSGYSVNAVHTGFVLNEGMQLIAKPYYPDSLLHKVREVLDS